jgi:uncharacterized FlaG/YvyC family protein
MDVTQANSSIATPAIDAAGRERAAALAEKRAASTEQKIEAGDASRNKAAEALAATREAIARALGLNTHLSITRSTSAPTFVYRAIDNATGEVVHEWPEETFMELVRGVRTDVETDVGAGLLLDKIA